MKTLVGFKRFRSKAGKDMCLAQIVSDATERDVQFGAVGQLVEEVFMPDTHVNFFKVEDIGKPVQFVYEMSGNRAFMVDVKIVK